MEDKQRDDGQYSVVEQKIDELNQKENKPKKYGNMQTRVLHMLNE